MNKLAVIGGGISGVSVAYLLQEKYEITLFEKNNYLGGNNHSTRIKSGGCVPMGVVLFPRKQCFPLTHEYAKTFQLSLKHNFASHAFLYNDVLQYDSYLNKSLPGCKHFLRNIKEFFYLFTSFKKECTRQNRTINHLIEEGRISTNCAHLFLIPLIALYLSMPYEEVMHLPLDILARWWCTYCLPLITNVSYSKIEGGNHLLIDAFAKRTMMTTRLQTSVKNIRRTSNQIILDLDNEQAIFDRVIIATRPDEVLLMLENPSKEEQRVLSQIDTGMVISTLHQVPGLTYNNNITVNTLEGVDKTRRITTTWGANASFNIGLETEHYVSIHEPGMQPVKDEAIIEQQQFKIPFPTPKTLAAIRGIQQLNQSNSNTYFCGSYYHEFFYHENAIASAQSVAQLMC